MEVGGGGGGGGLGGPWDLWAWDAGRRVELDVESGRLESRSSRGGLAAATAEPATPSSLPLTPPHPPPHDHHPQGVGYSEELRRELVAAVRNTIGAFAAPDVIHWVRLGGDGGRPRGSGASRAPCEGPRRGPERHLQRPAAARRAARPGPRPDSPTRRLLATPSTRRPGCPRRAPARSCAACCARSLPSRRRSWATPPLSPTPPLCSSWWSCAASEGLTPRPAGGGADPAPGRRRAPARPRPAPPLTMARRRARRRPPAARPPVLARPHAARAPACAKTQAAGQKPRRRRARAWRGARAELRGPYGPQPR
jgi:hypothetical protein